MPLRKKALQTQIDENLKLIFEDDAQAELPDRLLRLLDRLDDIEVPQPATAGDDSCEDTGGTAR